MNEIQEYLPLLIPIAILQLSVMVVALVHIFKHRTYKVGSTALWAIVVVLFAFVGPILYFVIGKDDSA